MTNETWLQWYTCKWDGCLIGLDDLRGTGSTTGAGGSSGISSRKSSSSVWWTWMIESWGIVEEGGFGRIVPLKIVGIVGTQGKGKEG